MSANWSGVDSRPRVWTLDLVRLLRRDRRLVQGCRRRPAGSAPARRPQHLTGIEVPGRNLVRVEPVDPHGVLPGALELHVADAWQPGQRVLHMQRRVVRHVERVARFVRRVEVDGQQDVRRRLADLHAQALDVVRQPWQRILDTVLRQHLRHVQIGADLERHGNGQLAVAGRLAAEIQHVLDAVDLLFERRRHGARDGFGRRARIGRRHLDGRRHDLRILRNRQDEERTEAHQGQEGAEDCREDRPVDEEMREAHDGTPPSSGRRNRRCR